MRLEEQVTQDVRNNAKIVITAVENDESTTVGIELQLEIQPAEVRFLTEQTYVVQIGICLTKWVLHPTTCLMDTRAGQNLIN